MCGHHSDDAGEMVMVLDSRQGGDIPDRHAGLEWDAGKYLELVEPPKTRNKLNLCEKTWSAWTCHGCAFEPGKQSGG